MKTIHWITILIVVLVGGYFLFQGVNRDDDSNLTDSEFPGSTQYICAEGKSFVAEFGDKIARVSLSGGEIYTLENTPTDTGVKYSNHDDQVVFVTKDYGGSVSINGVSTYSDCIYVPTNADVTRSGKILSINTDGIAFDGPILITLEGDDSKVSTISVPTFGLPLCEAHKASNIVDVYNLKVGQKIEVAGKVDEMNHIVPCEAANHYLR